MKVPWTGCQSPDPPQHTCYLNDLMVLSFKLPGQGAHINYNMYNDMPPQWSALQQAGGSSCIQ
jgi:hypothetical protein